MLMTLRNTCLFFALILSGCQTVTFRVVDALTQQPVPGVEVARRSMRTNLGALMLGRWEILATVEVRHTDATGRASFTWMKDRTEFVFAKDSNFFAEARRIAPGEKTWSIRLTQLHTSLDPTGCVELNGELLISIPVPRRVALPLTFTPTPKPLGCHVPRLRGHVLGFSTPVTLPRPLCPRKRGTWHPGFTFPPRII